MDKLLTRKEDEVHVKRAILYFNPVEDTKKIRSREAEATRQVICIYSLNMHRAQQLLLRKQELLQKFHFMFYYGCKLRFRENQTIQVRSQIEANFKKELDLLNRELR